MILRIFLIVSAISAAALATTEWFGDLRAHLNPPNRPAFYDISYDDSECTGGVQSNVVPEFVYFGQMVASRAMAAYTECLHMCLMEKRCRAVNFFDSLNAKEKGFCELLSESQHDNPRLMRPFRKASYYDNIRCNTASGDDFEDGTASSSPITSSTANLLASTLQAASTTVAAESEPGTTVSNQSSHGTLMASSSTVENQDQDSTSATDSSEEPKTPKLIDTLGSSTTVATIVPASEKAERTTKPDAPVIGFRATIEDRNADSDKSALARQMEEIASRKQQQLTRREVMQRLAAKIREFNRKFAVN